MYALSDFQDIIQAQHELRQILSEKFSKSLIQDNDKIGECTDNIGALSILSVFLEDIKGKITLPLIVNHYSDGLQNVGIPAFNSKQTPKYLNDLNKKLGKFKNFNGFNTIDEFNWYGSICVQNLNLTLTQTANLEEQMRNAWTQWLTPKVKTLHYQLNY